MASCVQQIVKEITVIQQYVNFVTVISEEYASCFDVAHLASQMQRSCDDILQFTRSLDCLVLG